MALYDVKLYTDKNDHYLRINDEDLAALEENLDKDVEENFAQVYCLDSESVVGIRLDAVELYTVKEVH